MKRVIRNHSNSPNTTGKNSRSIHRDALELNRRCGLSIIVSPKSSQYVGLADITKRQHYRVLMASIPSARPGLRSKERAAESGRSPSPPSSIAAKCEKPQGV